MIVKTIQEITNMMHANVHGDIDDTRKIHGVVIDSRQVTKDVLYEIGRASCRERV